MTQTSTGRHFQLGIDELKRELATQGTTVAARLAKAIRGLAAPDVNALDEVALGDGDINARQMAIDDRAFKLLALQQPVAIDLRVIVAAIKVNARGGRLSRPSRTGRSRSPRSACQPAR